MTGNEGFDTSGKTTMDAINSSVVIVFTQNILYGHIRANIDTYDIEKRLILKRNNTSSKV